VGTNERFVRRILADTAPFDDQSFELGIFG
jgi:hypothetical protein